MTVEILTPHGFCAGVTGALEKARRLASARGRGRRPVYCLHEIVHNELVVADLKARGFVFVEDLEDVPRGATVLFSAHGVSPAVRAAAAARKLRVVDATCPFVARVHAAARAFAERGLPVAVIGKVDHVEVQGIVGEIEAVGGRCAVFPDMKAVESALPTPNRSIGAVSQTTMNADEVARIVARLRARFKVETMAEVCHATKVRQDAVKAFRGDALLVLGSAASSNTRRLCEVARCRTFRAGTLDEVMALDLSGVRTLGVTAGASTPEEFITAAVDWLKRRDEFPVYACPYAQRLAARSRRFARQVYEIEKDSRREPGDASLDISYSPDPFGELTSAAKVKGLKQRFPDRVLVMTTEMCFMTCRHCTRQGLFGRARIVETSEDLARCVAYVKDHPKVRDVLLSGGDVLTLPDAKVKAFVDAFAALDQVEIVRVCTRAVCANPARITAKLTKMLGRSKKVWVNTQFNCADEVTPEARAAAARLVEAGIPVSCQTVLLKGVNDSAAEMLRLFRALTAARIRPYYVFQCDPIPGIDRFRVPLAKARAIERACAERIGGLALPRFVCDVPGAKRKIPIAEVT